MDTSSALGDCPRTRAEVAVLRQDVEYLKRRIVALQIKMIEYERKNISNNDRLRHGVIEHQSNVRDTLRTKG